MEIMVFKFTPKEVRINALLKEVKKLPCRIQIDFERGFAVTENTSDTMIDMVTELIEKYYTISKVYIVDGVESDDILSIIQSVTEDSKQEEVGPQSEKDLAIEEVKFKDEYVEQFINKFLRTAYWAMFKKGASALEIRNFILTTINEISMRYGKKNSISFSIGDVVDCNYGMHLDGETEGGHVFAIVCNISYDGMVYVVPITDTRKNPISYSYLRFTVPNDIVYHERKNYGNGMVLLEKGKEVRPERFQKVIGRTTPEFFAKLLNQLASTFDFTGSIVSTTASNKQEKQMCKKYSNIETVLTETLGFALDKVDSSKKPEDQIESFLVDIGMSTSGKIVKQCFVIACDIKKITYENVILELHKIYPNTLEGDIKAIIQKNFKKWLEQYPELTEKCHRISLMSVLKVFAKRFI